MNLFLDATVMQQPATGIAKSTLCLYAACMKLRPELSVSALHRRPLQCLMPAGVHPVQFGSLLPGFAWRRYLLPAYLRLRQPAATHFPWNGNVPGHLGDARVITTLNDVLPLVIPGHFASAQAEETYRTGVQNDIDRTNLLITISDYSKQEISRNFRVRSEPVVVHLGPTLSSEPGSAPLASGGGDFFLYLGGYDRRKGIDKLLKVFLELHRQKLLHSRLILTGSKHYFSPEFKALVEEGLAMGVVQERGYVTDAELLSLLGEAKALVYPSKYEGFGLPPLEAMSVGCPVITTRFSSIPEICGDAAYYVNPDDEADFAAGLLAFERDQKLYLEFQHLGLERAQYFSWESSARTFLGALDRLLGKTK